MSESRMIRRGSVGVPLAEAEAMKLGCKKAVLFTMLIHAPGALERLGGSGTLRCMVIHGCGEFADTQAPCYPSC